MLYLYLCLVNEFLFFLNFTFICVSYVCLWVCVCMCVYVSGACVSGVCVRVYIYVCVSVWMCEYMCVYVCVCISVCLCECVCVHAHHGVDMEVERQFAGLNISTSLCMKLKLGNSGIASTVFKS